MNSIEIIYWIFFSMLKCSNLTQDMKIKKTKKTIKITFIFIIKKLYCLIINKSWFLIYLIYLLIFNQQMAQKKNDASTFVIEFLMGGVSAAVSKTLAAPIELVKLRLQNMDAMLKSGALETPYTGIVDCTSRVAKEEGVKALWKGNGTNVLRYFPTQALNFAFKDYFKRLFGKSK